MKLLGAQFGRTFTLKAGARKARIANKLHRAGRMSKKRLAAYRAQAAKQAKHKAEEWL